MKVFFDEKKFIKILSKTSYSGSPIEANKSLKHEIKSIISDNESLAGYVRKN